jgi:hypothetical protein
MLGKNSPVFGGLQELCLLLSLKRKALQVLGEITLNSITKRTRV